MAFVTPTPLFSVPPRGSAIVIDAEVASELGQEYRLAAFAKMVRALDQQRDRDDAFSSDHALDATTFDSDYIPSPIQLWDIGADGLRPKRTNLLLNMTPFPDSFSGSHLRLLDFRFIKWDEQPGALVDQLGRISAMYFGSPLDALPWERSVIQAGLEMLDARTYLVRHGARHQDVDAISAGLRCFGPAGNRPQNMREHQPVSVEDVVLTELRNSAAIQTIASFQNAMLKAVAPRAWTSANHIIDVVLDRDPSLRPPFYLPNQYPPFERTAFSRAEYWFSTNGIPRREVGAYVPSLSALTSLGHYHATEGELILWSERKVVNFPVGATILLPSWMPYSFTSVDWPGYQMLFSQSCDHNLFEYVQNGFSGNFTSSLVQNAQERRKERISEAERGAELYGTLKEFDRQYANGLL
ncbi:hypothetical protein B0H13DRAFT_1929237 [Mycena leptocephala]|nr:hypothetical protein B0H13DRAFT_1929237 [Mycena leptocephala]